MRKTTTAPPQPPPPAPRVPSDAMKRHRDAVAAAEAADKQLGDAKAEVQRLSATIAAWENLSDREGLAAAALARSYAQARAEALASRFSQADDALKESIASIRAAGLAVKQAELADMETRAHAIAADLGASARSCVVSFLDRQEQLRRLRLAAATLQNEIRERGDNTSAVLFAFPGLQKWEAGGVVKAIAALDAELRRDRAQS